MKVPVEQSHLRFTVYLYQQNFKKIEIEKCKMRTNGMLKLQTF